MKKLIATLVPVLMLFAGAFTQSSDEAFAQEPSDTTINVDTDIDTSQNQSVTVTSGGDSDSSSKSSSDSKSIITSTEISNYKTRTPPITTFPPYLPYWNHGGWGTIKAYFPIPKSWPKWKKEAAKEQDIWPTGKPDLTNLIKNIEDCLVRLGFCRDDSQIVVYDQPLKAYSENPCWLVFIREIWQPHNKKEYDELCRLNSMYYILDKNGNPIEESDVMKWARWYETAETY